MKTVLLNLFKASTKYLMLSVFFMSILIQIWLSTQAFRTDVVKSCDSSDIQGTFSYVAKEKNLDYTMHEIVTKDNYIIKIFNIKHKGFNKNQEKSKGIVFLLHGFQDSADTWLLAQNEQNIAMKLLDQGYDIWLGNTRGNKYSNKHVFENNNTENFWYFTPDEMASYDLPDSIEYVLKKTKQKTLKFVGCSQGSRVFLKAISLPKTSKKLQRVIEKAVLLAPVIYVSGQKGWVPDILNKTVHPFLQPINDFFMNLGVIKAFPLSIQKSNCEKTQGFDLIMRSVTEFFLNYFSFLIKYSIYIMECINPYFYTFDTSLIRDDIEIIKKAAWHVPAGASFKNLAYYNAPRQSKKQEIRQYDNGPYRNKLIYGQSETFEYDFSLITTKISFYLGLDDFFMQKGHLEIAIKKMVNNKDNMKVKYLENFGHMTFILGLKNAKVINEIVEDIDE